MCREGAPTPEVPWQVGAEGGHVTNLTMSKCNVYILPVYLYLYIYLDICHNLPVHSTPGFSQAPKDNLSLIIDWLVDWLTDWLINRLIDWLLSSARFYVLGTSGVISRMVLTCDSAQWYWLNSVATLRYHAKSVLSPESPLSHVCLTTLLLVIYYEWKVIVGFVFCYSH